MSDAYIGEVRLVAFKFAPENWAFCDGSSLPISNNQALYALLGTTYGGDGVQTFKLPDLRGRTAISQGTQGGNQYVPGQAGGSETVTLQAANLPAHTHQAACNTTSPATSTSPQNGYPAPAALNIYAASASGVTLNAATVGNMVGAPPVTQAHDNLAPFITLNYIICLQGLFPTGN
jgi:microcystin-dependent protein